jgi:hypothetical protein
VLYYVLCVLFESSGESLRFDYFQRQVMHITMLALKIRILLTKVNGLMSGKRTCSTFFPSSCDDKLEIDEYRERGKWVSE